MLGGVNIGNVYGAIVGACGAVVATVTAWLLNHRTASAVAREDTAKVALTHDGSVRSSEAGELWDAYGELSRAQAELLKEVREQLAQSDREVAILTDRLAGFTDSNTGLLVQLEGMNRVAAELREEREQLTRQVEQLAQANVELREERAALAAQVEQLNSRIAHLNALLEEHNIEAGPATRHQPDRP